MYGQCKENPQLKCNKKLRDDKCTLGLDNKHCTDQKGMLLRKKNEIDRFVLDL